MGLDLDHIDISVSVLSCLHDVSLTNDWILHILHGYIIGKCKGPCMFL